MQQANFDNFPVNGILPKKETGALDFLSKYPNYDGRGVVIAILDTGVDPGAPGLQITSDGKPKIIDLIDATGVGNVDISTVRKVESDGFLTGLTGRKLKIPASWNNPLGQFNLGLKALFDLCPQQLRERLRKERKEKLWQPFNEEAIAQVQKKLNELNSQKSEKTSSESVTSTTGQDSKSLNDSNELFKTLSKEDLQAQLEILKDLESKVKDIGPVYDCLVWNDGQTWRACIDTTEIGDLENCKVLTNFRDSHEYGTFSYSDMLNYSVRILSDDKILEIVTDSSTHGTHVASIATGFYENKPELNGVAPGAQIISIKIGDNRVNGMETGFAFANACRYVIQNRCDLVNYSFGEPINFIHLGPALSMLEQMIEKYGVIFCGSAGNNGPGIETVDCPGSFVTASIGVAAYVSSDMIKAEHSLLGNGNSMLFTWSSRGPHLDGHYGATCCAPGGAFAAVPNWTFRGQQLMSGTSMASPNCCGCIALMLSGLKSNNIEFNPFGVKRAIQNTALPVDEIIGSGAGLIQVEKAYEYLVDYKDSIFQKMAFDVKYSYKNKTYRGIYLKKDDEVNETRDYAITIEPQFFDNEARSYELSEANKLNDENTLKFQKEKISLNRKLALVVENNDNATQWIECPSHLFLVNSSRQFFLRIRANELEEGRFYYTIVKAYDMEDPKKPCLFRVPVTVVKPFVFNSTKKLTNDYELEFKNVTFKQGQINRHFIRVPLGATHGELVLTNDLINGNRDHAPLFFIQTFTLGNFRTPIDAAKEESYRLNATNDFKFLFKTQPNKIIQVTVAKNWSNIGQLTANYKIKLNGLYPKSSHELCALSSQPYPIEIGSYLRNEDCEPSVQYKYHVQPLKASEHQIELVKQNIGVIKPIYQIVLTYNFHQTKTDDVCCEVPLLSNHLYENEFLSMFWMIYEANTKRFVLAGDAFPIIYKYSKSLDKGDYVIKLHIRHEKTEMLEKLKDITLNVRHNISGGLSQDIYTSYQGLLKGVGKKNGSERIQKKSDVTYFLNPIADDKLPKGIANGHYLIGELTLFKDLSISKVDNHRILYQINNHGTGSTKKQALAATFPLIKPKPEISTSNSNETVTSTTPAIPKAKTEDEKLKEAIRDIQVSYILKSNEIFEKLRHEHEDHVPIYINRIQYLEQQINSLKNDDEKKKNYEDIIGLSKLALEIINQNDLLKYLGEKTHENLSDEAKKEFENQKVWVTELLVHQGLAHIERYLLDNKEAIDNGISSNSPIFEDLKQVYKSIQKWIDINDDKVSKFTLKFYMLLKFYGKALKILFKQLDDKATYQTADQTIPSVLKQANLKYAQKVFENSLIMKYPKQYATF